MGVTKAIVRNDTQEDTISTTVCESEKKLDELRKKLKEIFPLNRINNDICIYACGSLGRLDMVNKSDLDLFFITVFSGRSLRLLSLKFYKYVFFKRIRKINSLLEYQLPSKNGYYLRFTPKNYLIDIGSQKEDYNNSFTARLLLLLESKPVYNEEAYNALIKDVVDIYFREYPDYKSNFNPQFLMNDILRYWYTLTLNYEYRRDPNDDRNKRYWKRLKLKYARFITCFSMIACLYKKNISPDYVVKCIALTPLERLSMLSEQLDFGECAKEDFDLVVSRIRNEYCWFLGLRKEKSEWWDIPGHKDEAFRNAEEFHTDIIKCLKMLSEYNPEFHARTELW